MLAEDGHGSWYFSVDLRHHAGEGRQRLRRGGYATRRDAERALERLSLPGGQVVTVADWLEAWLAGRARVREKTLRGYAAHVHRHLIPHLGRVLASAEAVARLILHAGRRPPGGGKIHKPSARPLAAISAA